MALTKIGKEGITGVSNAANATFLTATSAEGVTLAGTLAVTGVHTVGSNAVATGAGGSNTTIITAGLCKSWVEVDTATTPASEGSFNVASITDGGVGEPQPQMTSPLSSAQGVPVANNNESASGFAVMVTMTGAGSYRSITRNSSNTLVDSATSLALFGDLA